NIGQRQMIKPDHGEVVEYLAVAVEAQRKTTDDVLLRLLEFVRGRSLGDKFLERRARNRQRFAGLVLARLQTDHEWPVLPHRHEIAVGRVGEPAFFAHLVEYARHETA